MLRLTRTIFIALICLLPVTWLNAQTSREKDSVVQLYGVVMTADSLRGLPAVSIMVMGQNRGTVSNEEGVFSIVVNKGDRIQFSYVSYKTKMADIPVNLEGNYFSMIQLMVTDTVYLPATIIKRRISREQFERDFVNTKVPDDDIEIARANNNVATRRLLMATLPSDGREASSQYLRQRAARMYYSGQIAPQNIFNPMAWAEFIKAWKRGDFKKKG